MNRRCWSNYAKCTVQRNFIIIESILARNSNNSFMTVSMFMSPLSSSATSSDSSSLSSTTIAFSTQQISIIISQLFLLLYLSAPYGIGQLIIFSSCGFFFLFLLFLRIISVVADWMSTEVRCESLTQSVSQSYPCWRNACWMCSSNCGRTLASSTSNVASCCVTGTSISLIELLRAERFLCFRKFFSARMFIHTKRSQNFLTNICGGRGCPWGIFFGFYKTRHILLSNGENCTVLRVVVLTQYRRVTDGQTDGRTELL